MFVVLHRLVITSPAPSLWYKDQGGKENCIDLPVSLIDSNGNLVKSRRVPLKLTMYYESGVIVPRQDFLKIMSQTSIGETGEVKIRVRIEEVSRGHQKQNFVIRVSPDTVRYPLNNDISSVDSTPIDVMSKPRQNQAGVHTNTITNNNNANNANNGANSNNTTINNNNNNTIIGANNNNLNNSSLLNGTPLLSGSRKRSKDDDLHGYDTRPSQLRKTGIIFILIN